MTRDISGLKFFKFVTQLKPGDVLSASVTADQCVVRVGEESFDFSGMVSFEDDATMLRSMFWFIRHVFSGILRMKKISLSLPRFYDKKERKMFPMDHFEETVPGRALEIWRIEYTLMPL